MHTGTEEVDFRGGERGSRILRECFCSYEVTSRVLDCMGRLITSIFSINSESDRDRFTVNRHPCCSILLSAIALTVSAL